jgi:hypothetical protein
VLGLTLSIYSWIISYPGVVGRDSGTLRMIEEYSKSTPVIGSKGLTLNGLSDGLLPSVRCSLGPGGHGLSVGPDPLVERGIDSLTAFSVTPKESTVVEELGDIERYTNQRIICEVSDLLRRTEREISSIKC